MTSRQQIFHALLRERLYAFVQRSFMTLHAETSMTPAWHVEAMCWHLEQVATGAIRRLIITVPPRHLKSICASVALPAWWLGRDPAVRLLVASYGQSLAEQHARNFRHVVEADWFRRTFPGVETERVTATEFHTTHNGMRMSVSAGGTVTGFGADAIIIDDLMKAEDVHSDIERQRIKRIFDGTLLSRLDDQDTGRIVVIQQRLHEDDLVAYLLDKGGFVHLNLPAIADGDERIAIARDEAHTRVPGEALCPARQSHDTLERLRREMGSFVYSAQYLQNPTPLDSHRLRWEWFETYEERPGRDTFQSVVQSWDTAVTAEPGSDFSVCTTWGFQDGQLYLLDVLRARLEYWELKARVVSKFGDWQADHVLIEYASSGIPLVRDLRKEGHRQVTGCRPTLDKEVRFAAQTDKIQRGRVLIPQAAGWLPDFKQEMLTFPKGRYDDQVDSVTQFLAWWGHRGETRCLTRRASTPRRDIERRNVERRNIVRRSTARDPARPAINRQAVRPSDRRLRLSSVVYPGFGALYGDPDPLFSAKY